MTVPPASAGAQNPAYDPKTKACRPAGLQPQNRLTCRGALGCSTPSAPPATDFVFLMANTKSAIKNARKARRRMLRNKAVMTRLKTLRSRLAVAEKAGDAAAAKSAAIAYVSAVDRASRQGVVHANAAAHVKSHTAKLVFAK